MYQTWLRAFCAASGIGTPSRTRALDSASNSNILYYVCSTERIEIKSCYVCLYSIITCKRLEWKVGEFIQYSSLIYITYDVVVCSALIEVFNCSPYKAHVFTYVHMYVPQSMNLLAITKVHELYTTNRLYKETGGSNTYTAIASINSTLK